MTPVLQKSRILARFGFSVYGIAPLDSFALLRGGVADMLAGCGSKPGFHPPIPPNHVVRAGVPSAFEMYQCDLSLSRRER